MMLSFDAARPFGLMGVLNVTPDSFSDGGRWIDPAAAIAQAEAMARAGALMIDIGGESTRPGAEPVSPDEEWRRVGPVISALRARSPETILSIDTRHAATARKALAAGARIFNDVSALTHDRESMAVARDYAAAGGMVCLMHAQGDPRTMQQNPVYADVVRDVHDYLAGRAGACEAAGIPRSALMVDPGIGFGKTLEHNLALLKHLPALRPLGCEILLGASRKRFIGAISGEAEAAKRAPGSIAAAIHGATQGVRLFRVHDVAETAQALKVWAALHAF